jgi:hypothetical protein
MTTSSPTPQDQHLEMVRQGQDAVAKAMQQWSENVSRMFSATSSTTGQAATPEQMIDKLFDFAEQVLEVQRDFAKRLLAAGAPSADDDLTTAQPTTAQPTTRKPTTRKPTTRKPTTRKPTTRKRTPKA